MHQALLEAGLLPDHLTAKRNVWSKSMLQSFTCVYLEVAMLAHFTPHLP